MLTGGTFDRIADQQVELCVEQDVGDGLPRRDARSPQVIVDHLQSGAAGGLRPKTDQQVAVDVIVRQDRVLRALPLNATLIVVVDQLLVIHDDALSLWSGNDPSTAIGYSDRTPHPVQFIDSMPEIFHAQP